MIRLFHETRHAVVEALRAVAERISSAGRGAGLLACPA